MSTRTIIVGLGFLLGCGETVVLPDASLVSECGLDPLPPIHWEPLPNIGFDPSVKVGTCEVYVDQDETIYVSGWMGDAPDWVNGRTQVFRFDGSGWEPLAPEWAPDDSLPCVGMARAPDGRFLALFGHDVVTPEPTGWRALDMPRGFTAYAMVDAMDGGALLLGGDGDRAQLYRFVRDGWTPYGPVASIAERGLFDVEEPLAVGCGGGPTIVDEYHAFELVDGAWEDLGGYAASEDRVDFPAVTIGLDTWVAWRAGAPDAQEVFAGWHHHDQQFDVSPALNVQGPGASYIVPLATHRGDVFATWRERRAIYVARREGTTFVPVEVAAHTDGGTFPDIAAGPSGLPVVCWESGAGESYVVGVSRAVVDP